MESDGTIDCGIRLSLQGFYKAQVIDGDTFEVVKDYPLRKNLILNDGMNTLANRPSCEMFYLANAGTGSRPNSFGGGTSTIYQHDDNVVTFNLKTGDITDFTLTSASYVQIVEKGDVVQYFPSLSESLVLSITNADNLVVNTTYSFDVAHEQTFRIWKTSQHRLHGPAKNAGRIPFYCSITDTSLYDLGCSSSFSHSSIMNQKTWNFAKQNSSITYTEVGVQFYTAGDSCGLTQPSATFARALLDPPVTVGVGQRLRLLYQLHSTYQPAYEEYFTASFLGWTPPVYATQSIIRLQATYIIYNNGESTGGESLEPGGGSYTSWISSCANNLAPFTGSYDDRYVVGESVRNTSNVGQHWVPYVNNSFETYKCSSFTIYQGNLTNLRSIGVGEDGNDIYSSGQGLTVRFNEDQTKLDTQIMNVMWKWTWRRVLS